MTDLISLATVFVLVMLLLRRKVNLGISMLLGSVALAVLFRVAPMSFLQAAFDASTSQSTLALILTLLLIMALENVMRRTQMLRGMVESLGIVIPDPRVVMAVLPAVLGLLPSAGGARFSAPMVDEASVGLKIGAERKSFINYWYRHIWEFAFPLYPSLIMASQIIGVSIVDLIAMLFPFTVITILAGIPFAFRGLQGRGMSPGTAKRSPSHWRTLIWSLSPILVVAALVTVARVDITIALTVVLLALLIVHRYSTRRVLETGREAFSLNIVLLVLSVMIFKEVLVHSGAIERLPEALAALGVPGVVVVLLLPFLLGLATGVAQSPVVVGLPLISGLVGSGQAVHTGMLALAFVGGFGGVMLSPAHLCFVLTVGHFKADAGKVLRLVLVPELAVLLAAAGMAILHY